MDNFHCARLVHALIPPFSRPRLLDSGPATFLIMWGDIVKIIVELDDLCHIAARIEMYADLLDGLDEADDIDYVPGYTEEIKRAAQDLREVADDAEEVKGE